MSDFERLHPSLQHHVVNSLGWKQLRPVQEECVGPILDGHSVLVLAETAGGKTEAAVFPLLSRALSEGWSGLSIIYVCPIKALLNNLHERLDRYCRLVGRRCGLWHGDVGQSQRKDILADLPDILLTTPESLEVLLVHRHRKHPGILANVRAVVVDELHAFAGDDRGWHLLSVLARIQQIAGKPLQRVGLSATIGNADELLVWLAGSGEGRQVIDATTRQGVTPQIQLDYVGSLENAATVISSLHHGEKRLVFCDSRSRVEQLGRLLRDYGVDTFVSHSSLSVEQRRQAEAAFAGRSNCVIVATSTLELGIDVGDLDRVIQIDSPPTVAGFLQRLGRTGRRPGSTRNCLFLATSDEALLQAAGLIELWASGYVDPVQPPPQPLHIFAQQIMALCLQEGGLPRDRWPAWIGSVSGFSQVPAAELEAIVQYMLETGVLSIDGGLLWMGTKGEEEFGRRHFMELLSCFTSPPLFRVLHGRNEIGLVDQMMMLGSGKKDRVILLAGRSWRVTHTDWTARVAYVVPSDKKGRAQWMGQSPPLSFRLCRAMRDVVTSDTISPRWSKRAVEAMTRLRQEWHWCRGGAPVITVTESGSSLWWTFAGLRANLSLAAALAEQGCRASAENLFISTDVDPVEFRSTIPDLYDAPMSPDVLADISQDAAEGLKFSDCLPAAMAKRILAARLADLAGMSMALRELRG